MLSDILRPKHKKIRDKQEALAIVRRHGDNARDILAMRAADTSLTQRDRKHWKRILSNV